MPKYVFDVSVELPYVGKPTDAKQNPPPASPPPAAPATTAGGTGTKTGGTGGKSGSGTGSSNSGGQGSGGTSTVAQQTAQQCQQLAAQAQQFSAAGDLASAASALQQAKLKGCQGLDPNIDQAIAGAQGALDNQAQQKANQAQQLIGQCEFEAALQIAQQLAAVDPGSKALVALDMARLQAMANAQSQARVLLAQGKAAIEQNDVNGAIAALQSALQVPNLPDCMKGPAQGLLGDLQGRKAFGGLVSQVEQAINQCDYKQAAKIVGQATAIRPRTDVIQSWLNDTAPRLADLQKKQQEAVSLINQASSKAATARTDAERQNVLNLIDAAKQKVAPCELKLDPALANFGSAQPTVEKIPEDSPPANNNSDPPIPPQVESIPEDKPVTPLNQPPTLAGGSDPNSQGQKPPSGWQKIGTLIGGVISQSQPPNNPPYQPPPQPPPQRPPVTTGGGNNPPPQRPPQNPPPRTPPVTQPPPTTPPATSAVKLRVKIITGVSCSAQDRFTSSLGGVTVTLAGQTVTTDRGGVGRIVIPPGNYRAAITYSGGGSEQKTGNSVGIGPSGTEHKIQGVSVVSITVTPTAGTEPTARFAATDALPFKPTSNPGSMSEYEVGVRLQSAQSCQ